MQPVLIFLLVFTTLNVFSQCQDSTLVKPWGKWNELQFNSNVYRLEHRSNDSILPANIRKIVKEALAERSGEKFYSQIAITDLSIVIPLGKPQNSDDLIAEGIIKKGVIKYYYSFLFTENPNIQYRFNLALDVQGNILSEWAIPKIHAGELKRFVSFCEATEIGRNDKKAEVKMLNDINLMYDPKLNHFGWKVTIGYKYHKDDPHFKSYRLTINALTGEIIDRWDANVIKYDSPTHK
jgi:hypothetical protein